MTQDFEHIAEVAPQRFSALPTLVEAEMCESLAGCLVAVGGVEHDEIDTQRTRAPSRFCRVAKLSRTVRQCLYVFLQYATK